MDWPLTPTKTMGTAIAIIRYFKDMYDVAWSNPSNGAVPTYNSTSHKLEMVVPTPPTGKADKVAGAINGHLATLDGTGNLTDSTISVSDLPVLVGGKIPNSYISNYAITDTFVVASQAAMLALSSAEKGDVAIRTDESKSYILQGTDPAILANWVWLQTPVDLVTSVAGRTGNVVLSAGDIASGILATAQLGSGSASSSTFLRGDGAWSSTLVAASGATTFTVKAGPTQSTTNLQEWQDGSGVAQSLITNTGLALNFQFSGGAINFRTQGTTNGSSISSSSDGEQLTIATTRGGTSGHLNLNPVGQLKISPSSDGSSTGTVIGVSYAKTYNQTGNAGSVDFKIVRTETALGSNPHRFLDFYAGVAGTTAIWSVGNDGHVRWSTDVGFLRAGTNKLTLSNGASGRSDLELRILYIGTGADGQWGNTTGHMALKSTAKIEWSSTTNATAAKDVGLERVAASILKLTDGGTGYSRFVIGAPNSAIADANLGAGSLSFYMNEAGNLLTVKVKYADGTTIKTGTIPVA